MKAISAFHNIPIHGEIFLLNPLELGRVIGHESVGEMVYSVVINRREIPWLAFHQGSCDSMDGSVITQDLGKGAKSLILFLVDLRRIRNEGKDMCFSQLVGKHLETCQLRPALFRMNGAFWNSPAFLRIESYTAKSIGDHVALDRFRGVTRPPPDDITLKSALT